MDAISIKRLSGVAPELRRRAAIMLDNLEKRGIPTRVTSALRTSAEQAIQWAKGRTTEGPIVTYAPPGYSDHEFGMAIDVVPMTLPHGQPDWDEKHLAWKAIVEEGEDAGLTPGEYFEHHPDMPHFQLTGSFPVNPTDQERMVFAQLGLEGVWRAAGIFNPPSDPDIPAPQIVEA